MKQTARNKRHCEIEAAAYELLAANGYGATSLLRIAKSANASNETLYRWYGDKLGLFKEMVRSNAGQTKLMLQQALSNQGDPLVSLAQMAPVLLTMLLGDRAILLNRSAAADPTGQPGAARSQCGRSEIAPLIEQLIAKIDRGSGSIAPTPDAATELFLNLLIGDLQIRRVTGVLGQLSPNEIKQRADNAQRAFRLLLAV